MPLNKVMQVYLNKDHDKNFKKIAISLKLPD